MELNAEINRVVGEQMAVLLAQRIPEEELEAASKKAWVTLNQHDYSYGRDRESQLEKLIKERIVSTVLKKVDEILSESRPAEEIQAEAERIATAAKEKANELMINNIAESLSRRAFLPDLNGIAFQNGCSQIAGAIMNHR